MSSLAQNYPTSNAPCSFSLMFWKISEPQGRIRTRWLCVCVAWRYRFFFSLSFLTILSKQNFLWEAGFPVFATLFSGMLEQHKMRPSQNPGEQWQFKKGRRTDGRGKVLIGVVTYSESAVGWTYLEWTLQKRSKGFEIQAKLYSRKTGNLTFKRQKNSEQAWKVEQSHFQDTTPRPLRGCNI